jgi:transposase-like protein
MSNPNPASIRARGIELRPARKLAEEEFRLGAGSTYWNAESRKPRISFLAHDLGVVPSTASTWWVTYQKRNLSKPTTEHTVDQWSFVSTNGTTDPHAPTLDEIEDFIIQALSERKSLREEVRHKENIIAALENELAITRDDLKRNKEQSERLVKESNQRLTKALAYKSAMEQQLIYKEKP